MSEHLSVWQEAVATWIVLLCVVPMAFGFIGWRMEVKIVGGEAPKYEKEMFVPFQAFCVYVISSTTGAFPIIGVPLAYYLTNRWLNIFYPCEDSYMNAVMKGTMLPYQMLSIMVSSYFTILSVKGILSKKKKLED